MLEENKASSVLLVLFCGTLTEEMQASMIHADEPPLFQEGTTRHHVTQVRVLSGRSCRHNNPTGEERRVSLVSGHHTPSNRPGSQRKYQWPRSTGSRAQR